MGFRAVLVVGIAIFLAACGKDKDDPVVPPPPPANRAPVANAGTDLGGTTGEMLTLNGSGSSDPDGDALRYEWTVVSGPAGGGALTQATSASARFSATAAGAYVVRLTVQDPANASASASITVTVADPPASIASVVIDKPFLFLTAAGQSAALTAQLRDSAGAPVTAPVTWSSSAPGEVNVDSTGHVIATTLGSAQIVAHAGGIDSAPTLVVVAEPKPGALLVTDAQIESVGPPIGLLPGEAPGVGTRYEVRLSGVAAPAAGTVVLAAETSPVAGKVVSTRTEDGDLIATLEIAPLYDLLARYHIDWSIDLDRFPLEATVPPGVAVQKTRAAPRAAAAGIRANEIKQLEIFWCEGEVGAELGKIKMNVTATTGLILDLKDWRDDPTLPPNYSRHSLSGTAGFEGSVTVAFHPTIAVSGICRLEAHFKIPITGFVSVIVMPQVSLGVGLELAGALEIAKAEIGGTLNLDLKPTVGWECGGAQLECHGLDDVTLESKFTPKQEFQLLNGAHVTLDGHLFAYARLDAVLFAGLGGYISILEGRMGPKQSFDLATEPTQAENSSMASGYDLKIEGSIKPGDALKAAIKKVVNNDAIDVSFGFKHPIPIVESPKGSFRASKSRVALGDKMTFSVDIDPATKDYVGVGDSFLKGYNIDSVELWRKGKDDDDFKFFRNIPPIASGDSTAFLYEWTPEGTDAGKTQFAAFVNTKFPVPHLEIEADSVREVEVSCFSPGVQKLGVFRTDTCADEWTGFSTHLIPDGESLDATVTWKIDPTFDRTPTLVRYFATGSFVYHHLIFEAGGCTVSPTQFTIAPPDSTSANVLYVDYSTKPATFSGSGILSTELTASCPDDDPFTFPANLSWFNGLGNVSTDGLRIEGATSTPFGSSSFRFVRP